MLNLKITLPGHLILSRHFHYADSCGGHKDAALNQCLLAAWFF